MTRPGSGDPRFAAIDWGAWTPVHRATLLFVLRDDQVLLIRKKRGLGAGKINGPGGKLDAGEGWREAAIREVQEEVGVTPAGVEARGELRFQFVDGYSIHVRVFRASGCRGTPQETPEAVPRWFPITAVPYDEMWADDVFWLPMLFAGRTFTGRFLFDGDTMVGHELEATGPDADALQQD